MKMETINRHYRHNTSDRVATQTVKSTVQAVLRGGSRKSLRVVLLVGEAHLPRKWRSLGGSEGMPPKKSFGNIDALRCNLVHS